MAWSVKVTEEYAAWFTALIKDDLASAIQVAQARGHQLAETRRQLGLGQKQIAAAMGVSVARVSRTSR